MRFLRKVEYLKDRAGGAQFWEEHWYEQDSVNPLEELKKDRVAPLIRKWVMSPTGKPGTMLDGGCGSGKYLVYFSELGCEVVGVDFSKRAIKVAKRIDSNLKVVQASVLTLPFCSESFDYYLSLGVLEHFVEGPEAGLREAHRVLKKNGMFFLSVPYMNNLRTLGERLENWRSKLSGGQRKPEGEFYQYYFTKKELNSILVNLGFQVLKDYPLNQELGLRRAVPFVKKNRILNYLTLNLGKLIKHFLPWLSPHMVLLVCKRGDLDLHDG